MEPRPCQGCLDLGVLVAPQFVGARPIDPPKGSRQPGVEMNSKSSEGRESPLLSRFCFQIYGKTRSHFIRGRIRRIVAGAEGGEYFSLTLRSIFRKYHYRDVGLYTGGAAFVIDAFRSGLPGTVIGRYCSLTPSLRAFSADHPVSWKSTHAFFYNPEFGYIENDLAKRTKLTIGNDVWIGHNAVVLSTVSSIGDGAVIAAGSVVSRNVSPYAVVGGYPAVVLRYRFSPTTIERLLNEKWWERPIDELKPEFSKFQMPWE